MSTVVSHNQISLVCARTLQSVCMCVQTNPGSISSFKTDDKGPKAQQIQIEKEIDGKDGQEGRGNEKRR